MSPPHATLLEAVAPMSPPRDGLGVLGGMLTGTGFESHSEWLVMKLREAQAGGRAQVGPALPPPWAWHPPGMALGWSLNGPWR